MSVDTIVNKINQATSIKAQIKAAAESKGAVFPPDATFADYPTVIGNMKGLLQAEKTITPTAEGATVLPDEGYDGMAAVKTPAEPNLIPENISAGTSVFGVVGVAQTFPFNALELFGGTLDTFIYNTLTALRPYAFYNYATLTRADMAALTSLGQYAFYGCSGLQQVDISVLEEIGQYAFQNCTALTTVTANEIKRLLNYAFSGCSNLAQIDLSKLEEIGDYALQNCKKITGIETLTASEIGQYGCDYLGNTATDSFVYHPKTAATLGNYALRYARISEIKGELASVGQYAFAYCPVLTTFDAVIDGDLNSYAFAYNYYLSQVDFSQSNIKNLGSYVFYRVGYSRENMADNRLVFDMRNSTFKIVDQYAFGGDNSTRKLSYTDIFLPATVTTVNSYAFRYIDNAYIFFASDEPPTLSATNCFSNATNYKVFVPYNHTAAYKTKTNWTAISANIMGYSPAGALAAGTELPTVNNEGMSLTWYADKEKTLAITAVPDGSPEIYCESGSRAAWVVNVSEDENTTVTLVDTEGTQYTVFPALVPNGRGITLDIVHRDEWNNNTIVNGTSVELPYVVNPLSADLTITSSSWQGDIDPNFDTCTWENIKTAVAAGMAQTLFSVGSTRIITTKSGKTFTLRLANNTTDMYEYSDGRGTTGFVMEFVELQPDYKYMNPTSTNAGGWDACYMRTTVMQDIFDDLPDDLQAVIATVNIKTAENGNSATIITSTDKLFLPAEREIFASRQYSRLEEWNVLQRWQWYAQHDTNNDRIKKRDGTAYHYWERSPNGSGNFCSVYSNGTASYYSANYAYGVAPSFCI